MALSSSRQAVACTLGLATVCLASTSAWAIGRSAAELFRDANEAARSGDLPRALGVYRDLASSGSESASLYWNWTQVAAAGGERGEAMWAAQQAQLLDPHDRAVRREIERLRQALNLDPAELAPSPRAELRRLLRAFHLDLLGGVLLLVSLPLLIGARLLRGRALWRAAWLTLAGGLLLASVCLLAESAPTLGVVVRRAAPLLEAASANAEVTGSLREGEVVPILTRSGAFVRLEDSSGARGWASALDVRELGSPPDRLD